MATELSLLAPEKTQDEPIVMNDIPEKDWKPLRAMEKEKLAMACGQRLRRVEGIIQKRNGNEHEASLKVRISIQKGNAEIALMFDNTRHSKCHPQTDDLETEWIG